MKKLILIDSNALVHRAFHALPPSLNSQKGVMTNAVFGFTSVLLKMFKDLNPDYVIATFDLAGKTFRHEEFADYKVHRQKAPDELYAQIPLIKQILTAFGVPIFEHQGFEADDVIGALTEQAKKEKDLQVVIVTGDLDTLQLVEGEKVVVFTLRKGITDTFIYNEKEVKKRYGLKPSQVVDFKGLKGDPSDNIPGVPGVGEKTASMLVQEFGNVESMYEALEKPEPKKKSKKKNPVSDKLKEKLLTHKDTALFSKKLATIRRDVPLTFDIASAEWRTHTRQEELERLFKEFGFFSLTKRIHELFSSSMTNQTLDFVSQPAAPIQKASSKADIVASLNRAFRAPMLMSDVAGDTLYYAIDATSVYALPLRDMDASPSRSGSGGAGRSEVREALQRVYERAEIKKYGYDIKLVARALLDLGIHIAGVTFDVKIAAWLLNPDLKDYSLERMAALELERDVSDNPTERMRALFDLQVRLSERLTEKDLHAVFSDVDMPLISVLADMEHAGIKVDTSSLDTLAKTVSKELAQLEKSIYKSAGVNFNINSPSQLSDVLFQKLGIKGKVKRTSTGAISTAAGELEKLVDAHPIIESILRYRELQKLKTTYIDTFPKLIHERTGRIHTSYIQTGTATGRVSSQDPNLQNIPIRTEIGQEFRKTFVAQPGYKLVSCDYSQLDLRVVAHISRDTKMTEAFQRGEDIHTRTAAEIFNIALDAVTPAMRRQAKVMNFGLIYGMGVLGFQRASGVTREKAHEFIDAYMKEFSGVARYMRETKEQARKTGYVETLFGRKRFLPDLASGVPQLVAQAERIAINMPIQGTGSDFLKIAMIRAQQYIHDTYPGGEVRMLLQVHDELVFEVKNSLVEKVTPELRRIMEGVHALSVPLTVESKYGDNWRDMEAI